MENVTKDSKRISKIKQQFITPQINQHKKKGKVSNISQESNL